MHRSCQRNGALRLGMHSISLWLARILMIALVIGAASAQKGRAPAPRAYDVCSVKLASSDPELSIRLDPGGFTLPAMSAGFLVAEAFDVQVFQVFGLPSWATTDEYDVACKDTEAVAAGDPVSRMRSGLQALLADRFHLRYHRDSKPLPAATLRVGKNGLKIVPSQSSSRAGGYNLTSIKAKAWTMVELANAIKGLTGEKVVDKTGLTGRYDCELNWTLEDSPRPSVPLIANALSDRLGLTITRSVESTEVIIVDRIEKPSGN